MLARATTRTLPSFWPLAAFSTSVFAPVGAPDSRRPAGSSQTGGLPEIVLAGEALRPRILKEYVELLPLRFKDFTVDFARTTH